MRGSIRLVIGIGILQLLPGVASAADSQWVRQDGSVYSCLDTDARSHKSQFRRCDGPRLVYLSGMYLQNDINQGSYQNLEKAFGSWNSGEETYPDGTWKLDSIRAAVEPLFLTWKHWEANRTLFAAWTREHPDSVPEALVEVMYWQQYALAARKPNASGALEPGDEAISEQRLQLALQRLREVEPNNKSNPLWYPLMISTLVDLGRPLAEIEAVYDEGVTTFPGYLAIYYEMARALLPSQGGSEARYEKFAVEAARRSAAIDGSGMYARLYAYRDQQMPNYATTFLPSRPVSWKRMKTALTDLSTHHPQSTFILNLFASFACRAGDGSTYKKMRSAIAHDIVEAAWVPGYRVETCDLSHGIDPDAV